MNKTARSEEEIKRILLGFTKKEATREFEDAGYQVRIVAEDDEQYILTCDYVPTRANLSLRDGKVTDLFIG